MTRQWEIDTAIITNAPGGTNIPGMASFSLGSRQRSTAIIRAEVV